MRTRVRTDFYRTWENFDSKTGGKHMTKKENQGLIIVLVGLFMLSFSFGQAAWANSDRGGGGRGGLSGGVLQQLVFPCQTECRDSARDCVDTAESEGVTCIQSACATQVKAAQTACAADRTAQACKDAVSALRTCGDSCLTTFQSATTACRDTEQSCRAACDVAQ